MYRQTSPNVDSESFGAGLVSMINPAQRDEVDYENSNKTYL